MLDHLYIFHSNPGGFFLTSLVFFPLPSLWPPRRAAQVEGQGLTPNGANPSQQARILLAATRGRYTDKEPEPNPVPLWAHLPFEGGLEARNPNGCRTRTRLLMSQNTQDWAYGLNCSPQCLPRLYQKRKQNSAPMPCDGWIKIHLYKTDSICLETRWMCFWSVKSYVDVKIVIIKIICLMNLKMWCLPTC